MLVPKWSQKVKIDEYNCAETWPAFSHWPTCSKQHGILLQSCWRRCFFPLFPLKKDERSACCQKLVFSFMQRITIILLTDISERHTLKISEDSCSDNTAMHSDLLHGNRLLKKNLDNVLADWNSEIQWYSVWFLDYFSQCSFILKPELHPSVHSVTCWMLEYFQFYCRELLFVFEIYLCSNLVNFGLRLTLRKSLISLQNT